MQSYFVDLILEEKDGERPLRFEVKTLAIAMFCGRNDDAAGLIDEQKKMQWKLICEKFPDFCKVSRYLLTTDNEIEVQGNKTSGEVEVVAIVQDDEILIGVGSDHCDRSIEPMYYYKPKQMCPRVLSPRVWRYSDIADHWDKMGLSSSVVLNGRDVPFQKASIETLMTLPDLLIKYGLSRDGLVLYCGTVALPEDYIYGEGFNIKLHDPVLDRSLSHTYSVNILNDLI